MNLSHFQRDLEQLKEDILKMGGLVERAIDDAARALSGQDASLARRVIEGDESIDAMENSVDELCVKLLATQQPVAVDLRFITAAMKISSFLERMGDQAVNVAQRILVLDHLDPIEIPPTVLEMVEVSQEMVKKSLDSFVRRDVNLAYEVLRRDDYLDFLNRRLLEESITWMMKERRLIRRGLEIVLAGRHFERVGDEATNVAEDVVFLVEGKIIRHRSD